MPSSLGSAFGIAMSAAIYAAGATVSPDLVPDIFWGRQDNVGLRLGGGLALLFNIFMCVVALVSIMVTVPNEQPDDEREARPDVPASPGLGS
jgi:DHA2 family multidrug resistance protein-like MFS transporter